MYCWLLIYLIGNVYGGTRRVLTGTATLTPNPNDEELLINHADHDEVVYMDKQCISELIEGSPDTVAIEAKAIELRDALLVEEDDCLSPNPHNNGMNQNYEDFFFFLVWDGNVNEDEDCVNGIEIDMERYCISRIEYEPIFEISELFRPFCAQQSNPWWNLQDVEREPDITAYSGYHFSSFQNENLIVYVLDEPINYDNDEFSHLDSAGCIDASNCGILGSDYQGNHGSHVSGTIIGKTYGVLRDATIPLKGYGICGTDGCPWSYITSGLNKVIADLIANPTKRGVINMSIGGYCGSSCGQYDWYFDRIIEEGGIVVVAAGNSDADACLYRPAHTSKAITVGAYGETLERAWFSNYGACIDAWAPGQNIQSAYFNGEGNMQGTSMASPAIAGIVGALLAANDELELEQIKEILKCTHHSNGEVDDCLDEPGGTCQMYTASCGDLYNIAKSEVCEAPSNIITLGSSVTGSIESYEQAYYRFEITEANGDDSISFNSCGSDYDTYLYLYDANFNLIASNDDDSSYDAVGQQSGCGVQGSLYQSSLSVGDYWLGIGGWSSSDGTYHIAMSNGAVHCGETRSGTINSYQKHYYSLNVPGNSYGTNDMFVEACGSLYDTYLYEYDSEFSIRSQCDDCNNHGDYCGTRGDLTLESGYDGIRYIGIGGFSSSSGTYTLTFHCTRKYEFNSASYISWNTASNNCGSRDLATFSSQHDYDRLLQVIGTYRAYIGLNDIVSENTWQWEDGSDCMDSSSYCISSGQGVEPWAPGEPNDSYGEDCTELSGGLVNDLDCATSYYWMNAYICNHADDLAGRVSAYSEKTKLTDTEFLKDKYGDKYEKYIPNNEENFTEVLLKKPNMSLVLMLLFIIAICGCSLFYYRTKYVNFKKQGYKITRLESSEDETANII